MMNTNTGGQAFPVPAGDPGMYNPGMTLRDYFAAAAMQGALASKAWPGDKGPALAYRMADAMLLARATQTRTATAPPEPVAE